MVECRNVTKLRKRIYRIQRVLFQNLLFDDNKMLTWKYAGAQIQAVLPPSYPFKSPEIAPAVASPHTPPGVTNTNMSRIQIQMCPQYKSCHSQYEQVQIHAKTRWRIHTSNFFWGVGGGVGGYLFQESFKWGANQCSQNILAEQHNFQMARWCWRDMHKAFMFDVK